MQVRSAIRRQALLTRIETPGFTCVTCVRCPVDEGQESCKRHSTAARGRYLDSGASDSLNLTGATGQEGATWRGRF